MDLSRWSVCYMRVRLSIVQNLDYPRKALLLTNFVINPFIYFLSSFFWYAWKIAINRARHEKRTCLYYARSPSRDAQRVVQLYNDFRDSSRVSGPRSRDRSLVLPRLSHTNAITTKRRDAPTTYTRCFPVRDWDARKSALSLQGNRGRLRAQAYDRVWCTYRNVSICRRRLYL